MLTQSKETNDVLFVDLDPVIRGLGYFIVELNYTRRQGMLHVVLVIHSDDGVNVDACAGVYRAIYPRLEVLYDGADIQLEVSSPGIYRNFKSPREFAIFAGSSAKILLEGETEWQNGIIGESTDSSVRMVLEETEVDIDFADIRKAKLDYP